jgi:hypothetical protein
VHEIPSKSKLLCEKLVARFRGKKESGLGLDRKIAHCNCTHISEFFGVEFSSLCKK